MAMWASPVQRVVARAKDQNMMFVRKVTGLPCSRDKEDKRERGKRPHPSYATPIKGPLATPQAPEMSRALANSWYIAFIDYLYSAFAKLVPFED